MLLKSCLKVKKQNNLCRYICISSSVVIKNGDRMGNKLHVLTKESGDQNTSMRSWKLPPKGKQSSRFTDEETQLDQG